MASTYLSSSTSLTMFLSSHRCLSEQIWVFAFIINMWQFNLSTLTWLSEDATVIIGHVVQGDDLYIPQRAMVMIETFFFILRISVFNFRSL